MIYLIKESKLIISGMTMLEFVVSIEICCEG